MKNSPITSVCEEDRVQNQWSRRKNLNGKCWRVNRKKTRSGEEEIHFRASIDRNKESCREREKESNVFEIEMKWNWNEEEEFRVNLKKKVLEESEMKWNENESEMKSKWSREWVNWETGRDGKRENWEESVLKKIKAGWTGWRWWILLRLLSGIEFEIWNPPIGK